MTRVLRERGARAVTLAIVAIILGALAGQLSPVARPAVAQPAGALREFTLVAEPVRWEIQPGLVVDGWGYNGATPGPTIRVTEGDRVRVTLTNHLPVPTTIHWHGIDVPIAQDGVPGLSQDPVEPGDTFVYEFIATNPGTRWYHSHVDSNMQIQMGLFGAFIIDPRAPEPVTYDREYTYILTEKALDVTPAVAEGDAEVRNRDAGNGRGGAFQFDLFLMNGKAGTAIEELKVSEGERVRIRLINAGNLVHTMHTHGHSFKIIATDGNPVPPAAQLLKDTVLIGPAERYDVELVANNPGIWMFHCHINNHSANGMVTALAYEGAVPLAGGDHSAAHGPAAPQASPAPRPAPSPSPAATSGHTNHGATPSATPAPAPSASPAATLTAATTSDGSVEVVMRDDRFVASRTTVKAGTTVTWSNQGNNSHDTSSLDGLWSSGAFPKGESFSVTFDTPGTYQYLCRQHLLQGMRGVITVEE
jgi:FtsP/CotA-like multicopper oxidase with cupredoxin domain